MSEQLPLSGWVTTVEQEQSSQREAISATSNYQVDWILPRHAGQVARLEALVHPTGYRAGRSAIREQLQEAEAAGQNLSAGVFIGRQLVAYCLRFLEPDRRRICSYIGITEPEGLDLDGPGIYLADLATDPAHRKGLGLYLPRIISAGEERLDLQGLTVEAFCTRELLSVWKRRSRFISRTGLEMSLIKEFHDPVLNQTLHWLRFTPRPAPSPGSAQRCFDNVLKHVRTLDTPDGPLRLGIIDTPHAWDLLEPYWDNLLTLTPGATVFSSQAYLKTWWQQLLIKKNILLIVALSGKDKIRAIAPMQVADQWWLGRRRRCLGFLGRSTEVDRPIVLASADDQAVIPAIADYLMLERRHWDCVVLAEQQPDSTFMSAMVARLQSAGLLVNLFQGGECESVDVSGCWSTYLASRSRSQRKSIKRHLKQLHDAGEVRVEVIDSGPEQEQALERYFQLEQCSWKAEAGLCLAKSSAHLAFYRALVRLFAGGNAAHFRFLTLDGKDIAATFGLLWNGTLYSLSIVHDEAYRKYSPGFILTSLEIEESFERPDYKTIDYLGGFLSNKRGWSTNTLSTTWVYAHPRDLTGLTYHGYHFHVSPWIKARLRKFNLLQPALNCKRFLMKSIRRVN